MCPLSNPARIFTVTGLSVAFDTAATIFPTRGGSFMRAEPSPLLTIFGMGHLHCFCHGVGLRAEDLQSDGMLLFAHPA